MELSLKRLVAIFLPTLCLFSVFADLSTPKLPLFRETFADPDHYLDLYYETNPSGAWLTEGDRSLRFSGFFVRGDEQVEVTGFRHEREGERYYVFTSTAGRFVGRWLAGQSCASLSWRLEKPGKGVVTDTGSLRSATCL